VSSQKYQGSFKLEEEYSNIVGLQRDVDISDGTSYVCPLLWLSGLANAEPIEVGNEKSGRLPL